MLEINALGITGLLLFFAVAVTFADWRRCLFVAVPVALLLDPLRKLVPGQPVVYVVLVGVVIGAAALAALKSGVSLMPTRIRGWRRYLAAPFGLFTAILIFQALNALTRFGNVIIPMIGLSAYLTPFVALCLAYQTVTRSSENFMTKFFQFYVVCVFLALLSICLQYIGYHWSVLGEVGVGLKIYDQNTIMLAYSGLFRSSEVAAWHAATCVCFIIILTITRRITLGRALWAVALVLIIIGLGMLTGRRKFLVEIIVFVSVYVTLLLYFGRGAVRLALLAGFIGLVGFLALTLLMPDETGKVTAFNASYKLYVERSKTVLGFGVVADRINDLGLAPIGWAYDRYGLFGAGLGTGSQGVQQFGAMAQGAAEGGLGKIWLELGAPGFVVLAWFGWALTRHLWAILKLVSRQSMPLSRMAFGLASFLVANVAAFAQATQAYGDIFVLLVIGTALGGLLAMPVLAERALQKRVLSLAPNRSSVLVAHPA